MRKAVIVIGSSYGDEGKGLATAHFARELGTPCLNVLINGGAQRGHTVEFPDGRRHVFHHFGSATFAGGVSCADRDFIVNPLLYWDEREELAAQFSCVPRLLVSSACRVTLPWDMMLGQIIEENRGAARHGSCGCGILETRRRYEDTDWALPCGALAGMKADAFAAYCRRVAKEYLPARLNALGMSASEAWRAILDDERMIARFYEDLRAMLAEVELYDDWTIEAQKWPVLLFEAGQGLALDEFNQRDFPHLTPSRTTSLVSCQRLAALPGETEAKIVYVTRSYLTRHGAGPLPTECPVGEIGPDIVDRTNVPNPHQQSIRYGRFDGEAVLARVRADLEASRAVLPGVKSAALVTHLNETGDRLFGAMELQDYLAHFDERYVSHSPWTVEPVE